MSMIIVKIFLLAILWLFVSSLLIGASKYDSDPLFQGYILINGDPYKVLNDGRAYPLPFELTNHQLFLAGSPLASEIVKLSDIQIRGMTDPEPDLTYVTDRIEGLVISLASYLRAFSQLLVLPGYINDRLVIIVKMNDLIQKSSDSWKILVDYDWIISSVLPLMEKYALMKTANPACLISDILNLYDRSNPIPSIYLAPLCLVYADELDVAVVLEMLNLRKYFQYVGNLWPVFEAINRPSVGLIHVDGLGFDMNFEQKRRREIRYRDLYMVALKSLSSFTRFIYFLNSCSECSIHHIFEEISALNGDNPKIQQYLEHSRYLQGVFPGNRLVNTGIFLHGCPNLLEILNLNTSYSAIINRDPQYLSAIIWTFLHTIQAPKRSDQQQNEIVNAFDFFDSIISKIPQKIILQLIDWVKDLNSSLCSRLLSDINAELVARYNLKYNPVSEVHMDEVNGNYDGGEDDSNEYYSGEDV